MFDAKNTCYDEWEHDACANKPIRSLLNKDDEKEEEEEKESDDEWSADRTLRDKEESIRGQAEMPVRHESISKINPIFYGTRHMETQLRHGVVREVYPQRHIEEASYKNGLKHGLSRQVMENKVVIVKLYKDNNVIGSFNFDG